MYTCEKCGKEFEIDWRSKSAMVLNPIPRFCCRTCSNTHERSDKSKEKTRKTLLLKYGTDISLLENKYCKNCNKLLPQSSAVRSGRRVYCSKKCRESDPKRIINIINRWIAGEDVSCLMSYSGIM
jgi:hypothetical protein